MLFIYLYFFYLKKLFFLFLMKLSNYLEDKLYIYDKFFLMKYHFNDSCSTFHFLFFQI